jgi:hypothetical protein
VTGGSFWEGVRQGVISSALNHALHGTFEAGQDSPEKGDRRMPQRGFGFEEVYNGTSWVADWNGRFYHASGQVTSTGSPFELLLGSGIASSAVKVLTATKGGQTIVGEGMKRVSAAAAQNPGSVILNNMPKFTGTANQITSQMMTYNRQWILQQMRSGRPILDIGINVTRANPSIFYRMEQNMIKNYLKLHPNAFQIIK